MYKEAYLPFYKNVLFFLMCYFWYNILEERFLMNLGLMLKKNLLL